MSSLVADGSFRVSEDYDHLTSLLTFYLPPLKSIQLLDLPVEIIQKIVQFLPPSSAACFSICSRSTKYIIGTQYLEALSGFRNEDRRDFLFCQRNAWPDYFCCQYCYLLHPTSAAIRPGHGKYSTTCVQGIKYSEISSTQALIRYSHITIPEYTLDYNHVQLAMLRDHHGHLYGMGLEELSHTCFEPTPYPRQEILSTVEARIAMKSLILRRQQVISFPGEKIRGSKIRIPGFYMHRICPHIALSLTRSRTIYSFIAYEDNGYWLHLERAQTSCQDGIYPQHLRCHPCRIELQFQVKYSEDKSCFQDNSGRFLVTTVWSDLGDGKVFNENILRGLHPSPIGSTQISQESVRTQFEQQPGLSVETLANKNIVLHRQLQQKVGQSGTFNEAWRSKNPTWDRFPVAMSGKVLVLKNKYDFLDDLNNEAAEAFEDFNSVGYRVWWMFLLVLSVHTLFHIGCRVPITSGSNPLQSSSKLTPPRCSDPLQHIGFGLWIFLVTFPGTTLFLYILCLHWVDRTILKKISSP